MYEFITVLISFVKVFLGCRNTTEACALVLRILIWLNSIWKTSLASLLAHSLK